MAATGKVALIGEAGDFRPGMRVVAVTVRRREPSQVAPSRRRVLIERPFCEIG